MGIALGKEVYEALVGVHAWVGCDSVSSFAGKGKVKALNVIKKNVHFRDTFVLLGQQWYVSDELFDAIQEFTCSTYCHNTKGKKVNELRYDTFCAKTVMCHPGSFHLVRIPCCSIKNVLSGSYIATQPSERTRPP